MKNKQTTSTGVGTTGVLAIVFIVLKLIGVITWSWGWVLAPLWMPVAICTVILIIVAAINTKNQ